MRWFQVVAMVALFSAIGACDKETAPETGEGESGEAAHGEPSATAPSPGSGVSSVDAVPELMSEALALGEATWPGAEVGGVKVGPELSREARRNVYTVRVSFEFTSDPGDSTARSGSVVCNPSCDVIRHQIAREAAPPFPCAIEDALAVAREAGLVSTQPTIEYGYWSFDGRPGWVFRDADDGPEIEVGPECAVGR